MLRIAVVAIITNRYTIVIAPMHYPLHIEISQLVRFGQTIHKWCHTGYRLIIQLSADLKFPETQVQTILQFLGSFSPNKQKIKLKVINRKCVFL